MEATQKRVVNIYTEANPNPSSLKFCAEFMLLPDGKVADFADPESAARLSPLATELFKFSGVKRVFIAANFVTITKSDEFTWNDLAPLIKTYIKGYLEEGKPLLIDKAFVEITINETEIVAKIKSLLDEYVRPAVESDGGAITFHSFNEADGQVKVHLQGSCSGCPSSTITLKQGIENLLTRMIPEVKSVVAEGV